jgi:hypothetical protein
MTKSEGSLSDPLFDLDFLLKLQSNGAELVDDVKLQLKHISDEYRREKERSDKVWKETLNINKKEQDDLKNENDKLKKLITNLNEKVKELKIAYENEVTILREEFREEQERAEKMHQEEFDIFVKHCNLRLKEINTQRELLAVHMADEVHTQERKSEVQLRHVVDYYQREIQSLTMENSRFYRRSKPIQEKESHPFNYNNKEKNVVHQLHDSNEEWELEVKRAVEKAVTEEQMRMGEEMRRREEDLKRYVSEISDKMDELKVLYEEERVKRFELEGVLMRERMEGEKNKKNEKINNSYERSKQHVPEIIPHDQEDVV